MIDKERIGIYPAINDQTNKADCIVLIPENLKPGFLEEIVKRAAVTAETSPREFVFTGSTRGISHEMLKKLGKLPEDGRSLAVSSIVQAIPSSVKAITVYKLP